MKLYLEMRKSLATMDVELEFEVGVGMFPAMLLMLQSCSVQSVLGETLHDGDASPSM